MTKETKKLFKEWLQNMHEFGLLLHVSTKKAMKTFVASMKKVDDEKLCDDANQ